jgi:hypothetical protein
MSKVILTLEDFKVAIDCDAGRRGWVCSICGKSTKYPAHIISHIVMHHTGIAEYVQYFSEIEHKERKEVKVSVGKVRP